MDQVLPVWAQPHVSLRLREADWPQSVFTFGLALMGLTGLASPEGVRHYARFWGYEWLAGLSAGVHQETRTPLPPNALERFLYERHGIIGPNHITLEAYGSQAAETAGPPPDEILEQFASEHGAHIHAWALNAFNGLDSKLYGWAKMRQSVEPYYGAAAKSRLGQTKMVNGLVAVHTIQGRQRWAREYLTLHERVAIELEDLAIRRPRLRLCPLCGRPFVPIREAQRVCASSLWDSQTRRNVEPCTPSSDRGSHDSARAAIYKTQRKTQWARMNRVRKKYGSNDPRTHAALTAWDTWRAENPAPRPRGRPSTATPSREPPPFRAARQN